MKNFVMFTLALCCLSVSKMNAQCIKDIQNLVQMPEPCFFIGMIDFDNPDCFEASVSSNFRYKWMIHSADDGEFIAMYEGVTFQHTFKKFGGYEFCLEVDNNNDNHADIIDCVTYTTCQICTEDRIEIDYLSCPYGSGCDINASTRIHAQNSIGLEPNAKIIFTYLPTAQELLGGLESFDLEFDEIALEFNSLTDSIMISQNFPVPYKRGCYIPKIIFYMMEGYGAHGQDGVACTEIVLQSDQKFRCIACGNDDGSCRASEIATAISNEDGTCDLFTTCHLLREDEASGPLHEENGFGVSPNPANENIHVEMPEFDGDTRTLSLFNNLGQPVLRLKLSPDEVHTDLDVSQFSAGLYLLTITENGKSSYHQQVVIARN